MKLKIPYSIRKSLIKILPFVATAIMSTACHKEPYDVVIDWDWDANMGWAPPKSMVEQQANKKDVKTVFINLTSPNSAGMSPYNFHNARNELQQCLDTGHNKVRGKGDIYINPKPGADNRPNHDMGQDPGIAWYDKQWFEENGWEIKPWVPPRSK